MQAAVPTPKSINVAFADDNYLVREAFSNILKADERFNLIGVASNGLELLEIAMQTNLDLVILDYRMPIMDAADTTIKLKEKFPDLAVLVISSYNDSAYIMRALSAGAKGYVLKECEREELFMGIDSVLENKIFLSPKINTNLINVIKETKYTMNKVIEKSAFTIKELEIIKLICYEYTANEIAEKLKLSPRYVEGIKATIQHKMKVKQSIGIAIVAVNNKLIDFD
jgi:DNA-binding NarL/FixJ family response regulator